MDKLGNERIAFEKIATYMLEKRNESEKWSREDFIIAMLIISQLIIFIKYFFF